jgi:hypothetical protein
MTRPAQPAFYRIIILLSAVVFMMLLTSCGGQKERDPDIPTEAEAIEAVEKEMGIKGATVLSVQDVRNAGHEYHSIDAIYEMTSDRGLEFTVLRSCEYDSLFGLGYYYGWKTDYSEVVLTDYMKDHPLPDGVYYSDEKNIVHDYGASTYFEGVDRQIWFEFASDEEFERYIDVLEPWLNEWLNVERKFMVRGKDPILCVGAYKVQDDTVDYPIYIYRLFGYEKDSFHIIGADGNKYRWSSFRRAMESDYEARKELLMK